MIVTTEKLEIIDINNPNIISDFEMALKHLLHVPDERVKPKIIQEIISYYKFKHKTPGYRFNIYVAKNDAMPLGCVVSQIDPEYRTYSRKATTFAWLLCEEFEVCKVLMERVENFARIHKVKKIRGPINYPKMVGGIGIQTEGFKAPIINGLNFNHPSSKILEYLNEIDYESESKYSCVH